jgi:SulP family sulfate permease
LQAQGGKLILAGISPALRDQLQRTGMLSLIGEQNLFPATESIGESGNIALQAARDWLADTLIEDDKGQTDMSEKVL